MAQDGDALGHASEALRADPEVLQAAKEQLLKTLAEEPEFVLSTIDEANKLSMLTQYSVMHYLRLLLAECVPEVEWLL